MYIVHISISIIEHLRVLVDFFEIVVQERLGTAVPPPLLQNTPPQRSVLSPQPILDVSEYRFTANLHTSACFGFFMHPFLILRVAW